MGTTTQICHGFSTTDFAITAMLRLSILRCPAISVGYAINLVIIDAGTIGGNSSSNSYRVDFIQVVAVFNYLLYRSAF